MAVASGLVWVVDAIQLGVNLVVSTTGAFTKDVSFVVVMMMVL